MHLMTSLLLLLVASRLLGELAERRGQPAMIGEILAGVLLGPSILGFVAVTPELRTLSDLGVFLLVFLAGMELDPAKLADAFKGKRSAVAVASFFVPLFLGIGLGAAFGLDRMRMIFLGLCIAITALPVAVRMLMDADLLDSDVGRQIISAAIANDILALLILGVILDVRQSDGGWGQLLLSIAWTGGKSLLFILAIAAAYRAVQGLGARMALTGKTLTDRLEGIKSKESIFALAMAFVLVFASVSESIGLHFVVGAFFGSMLLSREIFGPASFEYIRKSASGVTIGFLAPIFFAQLGLEFDASALKRIGLLTLVVAAAFLGKIGGGYIGARIGGYSKTDSALIGVGLNGRGIMELVIANIALSNGFIGSDLFSVLVLMGVLTTMVTPSMLKRLLVGRHA